MKIMHSARNCQRPFVKYVIAEKYENIRIKKCISRKKHFLLRGSVFCCHFLEFKVLTARCVQF